MMRIRSVLLGVLLCLAIAMAGPKDEAKSQGAYPNRLVKIVVAISAGGPADTLARVIADHLGRKWQQTVIVENHPGASGVVGAQVVKNSPADGYTLLLTITSHIQAIGLNSKLPYDPINDFAAVTQLGVVPQVFAVRTADGPRSLAELIAKSKADPTSVSFASFGATTTGHIYNALINRVAGINVVSVPYQGGAPALNALLGGHVTAEFLEATQARPQISAGVVRGLAITGSRRSKQFPEVPTFAEQGLAGFELLGWHGIFAPAGTPKEILSKISDDVRSVMSDAVVAERFTSLGLDIVGNKPEEFAAILVEDAGAWTRLIRDAGISAN